MVFSILRAFAEPGEETESVNQLIASLKAPSEEDFTSRMHSALQKCDKEKKLPENLRDFFIAGSQTTLAPITQGLTHLSDELVDDFPRFIPKTGERTVEMEIQKNESGQTVSSSFRQKGEVIFRDMKDSDGKELFSSQFSQNITIDRDGNERALHFVVEPMTKGRVEDLAGDDLKQAQHLMETLSGVFSGQAIEKKVRFPYAV